LPGRRAPDLGRAVAVVFPDAGAVLDRRVLRRPPDAPAGPALGESDHPADRGAARPALLRPASALDGRALFRRRHGRVARPRRVGLQPGGRPHRGRALARGPSTQFRFPPGALSRPAPVLEGSSEFVTRGKPDRADSVSYVAGRTTTRPS